MPAQPVEQTAGQLQPCIVINYFVSPMLGPAASKPSMSPVLLTLSSRSHKCPTYTLSRWCLLLWSPTPMQVALGDAAIVTGLHVGAKLPLSVSFAVAVAANLVLVLMLLAMLVVARLLNASNNSRLAAAANSPEVGRRSSAGGLLACQAQEKLHFSMPGSLESAAPARGQPDTCWPDLLANGLRQYLSRWHHF